MVLVWSLSIVGLVLIIIEVDGLTPTVFTNPHAIMGNLILFCCAHGRNKVNVLHIVLPWPLINPFKS